MIYIRYKTWRIYRGHGQINTESLIFCMPTEQCVATAKYVTLHFSCYYSTHRHRARVSGLDTKWVRLGPNGTNPGTFSDQISVNFGAAPKCTEI